MSFWKFKNESKKENGSEVDLEIKGDIVDDTEMWLYEWLGYDATSPNNFKDELKKHVGKKINIWIDSDGGDVFAAAGIYNALKEHDGLVEVKINKAMSAASVIAMAANKISMSPVGIMMIHNPWTQAQGDMRDLRKVAEVLDTIKETLINAYVDKTKKSREEIAKLMDEETWFSASAAVEENFADEILFSGSEEIKGYALNMSKVHNSVRHTKNNIEKYINKNNIEKEKLLLEIDLL